jgi:hypothetical protein
MNGLTALSLPRLGSRVWDGCPIRKNVKFNFSENLSINNSGLYAKCKGGTWKIWSHSHRKIWHRINALLKKKRHFLIRPISCCKIGRTVQGYGVGYTCSVHKGSIVFPGPDAAQVIATIPSTLEPGDPANLVGPTCPFVHNQEPQDIARPVWRQWAVLPSHTQEVPWGSLPPLN